jgi:hypothetical protein
MVPQEFLLIFEARPGPAAGRSLARVYEVLVLFYLLTLLFLYPYGIPLGADASIKAPDLIGLLCLLVGATLLALKQRVRADLVFLALVGPFVLLELALPVVGALGYRKPADAVSSVRMALLWLPMILLTMVAMPAALPRFERRLRLLLAVSLWLNIPYAIVLVAVDLGYLPGWMAITRLLAPWAVATYFDVIEGLRPAGFFASTTALSVFAIVCLSFFYARYAAMRERGDLNHALGSLFLVLMTTSRVAFASAALIVMIGWLALSGRRKAVVFAIMAGFGAAFLVTVEMTVGIEQAFYRFIRLAESGLLGDVSFGRRVMETWPSALAVAGDYPFGTLISAPRVAELLDSGYLNYYVQGKWLFVSAVVLMIGGQATAGLWFVRRATTRAAALMILFMSVFLALAMVVSNPVRSPVAIAFLVFAFWKLGVERHSRLVYASSSAGQPT